MGYKGNEQTIVTSLPKYSNELYKFINYKCIYIMKGFGKYLFNATHYIIKVIQCIFALNFIVEGN